MENIQRDLGELIQEFQVLFNSLFFLFEQQECDRKKHNDWQIMTFALHLQVLVQRQRAEGDEFSPLIVPIRGEAIKALYALFQGKDYEESDIEVEDMEEEKMENRTLEGRVFHLPYNHSRIRRFILLGNERVRSRTL